MTSPITLSAGRAAQVAWVPVDLNDLDVFVREEVGEGKVRAEHDQDVSVVDGIPAAAVAEKSGHADGVGVVVFEPLFAFEREPDGCVEFACQCRVSD